jgi:tRNA(Ile2) C34 agmatinyltransferase TiaS
MSPGQISIIVELTPEIKEYIDKLRGQLEEDAEFLAKQLYEAKTAFTERELEAIDRILGPLCDTCGGRMKDGYNCPECGL